MIYIALLLLTGTAAVCLGLSQAIPTRVLGFVAAGAALLTALLLLIDQTLSTTLFPAAGFAWAIIDNEPVHLALQLDTVGLLLALTLTGGGALLLLALALALAPSVHGFGGLFAWALLALAGTLLGISSAGLVVPFAWAATVVLCYAATRASGALNRSEEIPWGLTFGLLASLLLLVGLLTVTLSLESETLVAPDNQLAVFSAISLVLASLLLMGTAPFHSTLDEAVQAPAALGALLYGLVLPILALGTLARLVSDIDSISEGSGLPLLWHGLLLGAGLIGLLTSAAGALREQSMRRLLAWQASAQASLVLLALALDGALAALAVPALLINLGLTTIGGALAVATFERLIGSDDFRQMSPGVDLRLPGMLWAMSAASALGVPAFWGFWGRRWLFAAMVEQVPWVLPLLLMASVLLALAYFSPLARFWWRAEQQPSPQPAKAEELAKPSEASSSGSFLTAAQPFTVVLLLVPIPLLVPGLVPQLVGALYVGEVAALEPGIQPFAAPLLPVSITEQVISGIIAIGGVLVFGLLLQSKSARQMPPDADMTPVALAPDILAARLSALAAPARPANLGHIIWRGLFLLGTWLRMAMALFEQRFYLAGVLLALISLVLLLAQI